MYQALAPLKAQTVEQDGQHLEVIVLLVAHHVDHLVNGIVGETLFGRTDVLRHVDRRTVSTEQQLVVEAFARQVGPHGAVFLAVEKTFLQSFEHFLLAFQVCVRFVVYLVEADTHHLVSLVEAGIYPVIHLLPQGTHLRVTSLPLHEHLAGFLHQGRFGFGLGLGFFLVHAFGHVLGHQFLHLGLEMLVECHVVVADEMVALLATRLGRFTVAILQPSQHGLADVNTAIVHDVGLHHTVAIGGNDVGQGVTQQVVAHVPQVERLVGVGRRILDHHQRRLICSFSQSVVRISLNAVEQLDPCRRSNGEVQEALDDVELGHE